MQVEAGLEDLSQQSSSSWAYSSDASNRTASPLLSPGSSIPSSQDQTPPQQPVAAAAAEGFAVTGQTYGDGLLVDAAPPNEEKYCYCQQGEHGDMICCDNEGCRLGWFHFECVGLSSAPDTWLCPECSIASASTTTSSGGTTNGNGKRTAASDDDEDDLDVIEIEPLKKAKQQAEASDSDDDVMIIEAPHRTMSTASSALTSSSSSSSSSAAASAGASGEDDDDDDIEMVATSGGMLCDFPHSREHCTLKPWAAVGGGLLNQSHCPNCYCYVCDSLVGQCGDWAAHSHASCAVPAWRKARKDAADARAAAAADAAANASLASLTTSTETVYSSSSSSSSSSGGGGGGGGGGGATTANYSITELMKQVTQVYPEEVREPQSMRSNLSLRPYQKQSLAFALNVERRPSSADQSLLPPVGSYPDPAAGNRNANCFGGWICDEMGMGKTAVVIALCVANPPLPGPAFPRASDADWAAFVKCGRHKARPKEWLKIKPPVGTAQRRSFNADRKKKFHLNKWWQKNPAWERWKPPMKLRAGYHLPLKATMILTNVSLLGQWEDEFKRFAPQLVVRRHFGQKRWTTAELGDWRGVDVILSSMQQSFESANDLFAKVVFHRVVLDESAMMFNNPSFLKIRAARRWSATGTPCAMSVMPLLKQGRFLGLAQSLEAPLAAYHNAIEHETKRRSATPHQKAAAFVQLKQLLRRCMIRHTKAQRIGGAVALALPDELCSTVYLDMTAAERREYVDAVNRPLKPATTRRLAEGGKSFSLEMDLALRRHVCSRGRTKLAALRKDLAAVKANGEDVHGRDYTFYSVHQTLKLIDPISNMALALLAHRQPWSSRPLRTCTRPSWLCSSKTVSTCTSSPAAPTPSAVTK